MTIACSDRFQGGRGCSRHRSLADQRHDTKDVPPMAEDPREKHAKPPHPAQKQDVPGIESEMDPKPDYGEKSYKGSGKLKGKAAVITGGDSGIGRAVALAYARE